MRRDDADYAGQSVEQMEVSLYRGSPRELEIRVR